MFDLTLVGILSLILCLFLPLFKKFFYWRVTKYRYQHIPLPRIFSWWNDFTFYKFWDPIHGVDWILNSMRQNIASYQDIVYQGIYIDGSHTIGINDPEAIKQVLTQVENFIKLPETYDIIIELVGDGLVTSTGTKWKQQRRTLTPLFHFQHLKNHLPLVYQNTKLFLHELAKKHNNGTISLHSNKELKRLTLKVIIDAIFGGHFDTEKMGNLFDELVDTFYVLFTFRILFGQLSHIIGIPYFLFGMRSMHKIVNDISKVALTYVHQKRTEFTTEEFNDVSIVALLLQFEHKNGVILSDEEILAQVRTFLFAGHDTTSNTLAWAMQCIAQNPEVQNKLQQEASKVNIEATGASELKYSRATIQETLRLYPVVPVLDRQVVKSTTICNKFVPAGSTILLWFIGVQRDERYFCNPMEFQPERFLPENRNKIHPFAFCPFSAGPRNCIGMNFALQEVSVVVAMILKQYSIKLKQSGTMYFESTLAPYKMEVELIPRYKS